MKQPMEFIKKFYLFFADKKINIYIDKFKICIIIAVWMANYTYLQYEKGRENYDTSFSLE